MHDWRLILLSGWFWQSTALVAISAALCALVGAFLMLRRMSLLTDAVSHATLPGVVIGYMVGGYAIGAFLGGAILAGLGCVLLIGWIARASRLKEDTAIGVVFSSFFSLGIVLLSQLKSVDLDPGCVIYGEALAARPGSLELAAGVLLVALLATLIAYKPLTLSSFDPVQAELAGMPTRLVHYGLLVMLALSAVAALRAVGIVLSIAFFITPPATAFLLVGRLGPMLLLSVAIALVEALFGMALAVALNANPSGVTASLGLGLFLVVLGAQRLMRSRPRLLLGG